ncbi:iron-sulfur cluster assembly accessory protein [Consotaella salsifontis]|uniref:Iron-sulfur cluster assembly accessory protein n=1 Tax=Consotaella salsifontis TaxID=1365950 RepID=A0A1T4S912_9HYPH|nr:iron-sulfur cluster assembly accessory protein [Consotaella salsifontis]SKA24682.1 Iron-sulfur cluster assembly accessory protein [Consotaella salsifontis]
MLELTEAARTAIRTAIDGAGQPVAGLRIMVQSGGCAGLRYGMALELVAGEDDVVIEAGDVMVLLDPQSRYFLDGATVDFVTRLDGSGFVFDNPNAASTCGCGKSFC